jgi:hypothetical protein
VALAADFDGLYVFRQRRLGAGLGLSVGAGFTRFYPYDTLSVLPMGAVRALPIAARLGDHGEFELGLVVSLNGALCRSGRLCAPRSPDVRVLPLSVTAHMGWLW